MAKFHILQPDNAVGNQEHHDVANPGRMTEVERNGAVAAEAHFPIDRKYVKHAARISVEFDVQISRPAADHPSH